MTYLINIDIHIRILATVGSDLNKNNQRVQNQNGHY